MSAESTTASTERPNTVKTPKSDLSRHSDGRAGTVCLVLDAEALSAYGLDPETVESVTAIVEQNMIRLDHQ